MKHLKNYWMIVGVLFSMTVVMSGCDDDDDVAITLPDNEVEFNNIALTGEAEVQPTPVVTDGSGILNATYDSVTNVISFSVTWELGMANDTTTGMHFHGPATVNQSAPVVIGITLPANVGSSGSIIGETRPLTEAEEDQLLDGLWYLNIHSKTYPAGELRGQLD